MEIKGHDIKGIVSRNFVVCFLVPFDSSEVPTHSELVHLLFKFRFRVKFCDFCASVRGAGLLDYQQLLSYS
jgi:hypothetical protein